MFFADQDHMKRGSHSGVRAARRQNESRALILHMGMYLLCLPPGVRNMDEFQSLLHRSWPPTHSDTRPDSKIVSEPRF
jgi:hypothetical protein